jgi:hypothetical protein
MTAPPAVQPGTSAAEAHTRVIEQTWAGFAEQRLPVLGVMSPPGAGKSTLVRVVAERWVNDGRPQLPIVTQTNSQADDLATDLAADLAGTAFRVGRLHASNYVAPPRLAAAGVVLSTDAASLLDCDIVVAPARKWAYATQRCWEAAVIDEVFQMRSDDLLRVGDRFERLLTVGDPGQLNPFTTGDERLVRGRPLSPLETAADTLRLTHPDAPWLALPVSWRLPPSAASVVSDAFYTTAFRAGTADGDRQIHFPPRSGLGAADRCLVEAARSGWAYLELPEAHLPRTDPEMVEVIADLVDTIVGADLTITDEKLATSAVGAGSIAVGVAHRDQRGHVLSAVDRALLARGLVPGAVVVDTANRLQGRQFELMVAWHPLSGRRDASTFHLEAGRLCVLLSRHRHACVVVGRAGIREQLDAHPGTEPVWMGESPPAVDGWEANLALLDRLEAHRVSA